MKKLAPAQIGDWTASGQDQLFDRQTIFDHLNGGAEVYLHHGMVRLLAREYARPRAAAISLLIFDMDRASNAYGVYTHERAGGSAGVGQDSDMEGGLLRFWRGKYFVTITSFKHTAPARRAVVDLGKAVAGRIRQPGKRPALVGRLPAAGLDATSVRYLQSEPILQLTLPDLAGTSLGLQRDSEVVVAKYAAAGESLTALAASFVSASRAQKARAALVKAASLVGKVEARCCGVMLLAAIGQGPAVPRAALMKTLSAHEALGCTDGK